MHLILTITFKKVYIFFTDGYYRKYQNTTKPIPGVLESKHIFYCNFPILSGMDLTKLGQAVLADRIRSFETDSFRFSDDYKGEAEGFRIFTNLFSL